GLYEPPDPGPATSPDPGSAQATRWPRASRCVGVRSRTVVSQSAPAASARSMPSPSGQTGPPVTPSGTTKEVPYWSSTRCGVALILCSSRDSEPRMSTSAGTSTTCPFGSRSPCTGPAGAESASTTNGFGASSHQVRSGREIVVSYDVSVQWVASAQTREEPLTVCWVLAVTSPKAIAVPAASANTVRYASTPEVVERASTADSPSEIEQTTPSSSAVTR